MGLRDAVDALVQGAVREVQQEMIRTAHEAAPELFDLANRVGYKVPLPPRAARPWKKNKRKKAAMGNHPPRPEPGTTKEPIVDLIQGSDGVWRNPK